MTAVSTAVHCAVARHHIANLLHGYVGIADAKDVEAVVRLLGHARVRFPAGGCSTPEQAREFFAALWSSPAGHRHDVTNLIVDGGVGHLWQARAHYTRWLLETEPVLHTLGEYALVVDDRDWSISELTVTRTWTRG